MSSFESTEPDVAPQEVSSVGDSAVGAAAAADSAGLGATSPNSAVPDSFTAARALTTEERSLVDALKATPPSSDHTTEERSPFSPMVLIVAIILAVRAMITFSLVGDQLDDGDFTMIDGQLVYTKLEITTLGMWLIYGPIVLTIVLAIACAFCCTTPRAGTAISIASGVMIAVTLIVAIVSFASGAGFSGGSIVDVVLWVLMLMGGNKLHDEGWRRQRALQYSTPRN
ncbi:MAG: hypothetical protein LBV30_01850 [Propionibacteriaceae bacterium]|nr:hypothetical protein [Propionibacteriaceae bacterium]